MALGVRKKEGINTCYIILLKIKERFLSMFERAGGQNEDFFILALDFFGIVSYIITIGRIKDCSIKH